MLAYPVYYFVPWPDCQKYEELDENNEYVCEGDGSGAFVDKEWADKLNIND